MTRENKPGQFTTEVHKTKEKAFDAGKKSNEVPIAQAILAAEEALKEIGRRDGIRIANMAFNELRSAIEIRHAEKLEERYQEGFGKGLETGNKMIGEASYQKGYDRGVLKGRLEGFKDGFYDGRHKGYKQSAGIGVMVGGVSVLVGSIFGVVLERFMF